MRLQKTNRLNLCHFVPLKAFIYFVRERPLFKGSTKAEIAIFQLIARLNCRCSTAFSLCRLQKTKVYILTGKKVEN